jgi:predicted Zn-ribbon and HTH transcriptional regulator
MGIIMSVHLICKKCGHKFAASTMEYLSGKLKCPKCDIEIKKLENLKI